MKTALDKQAKSLALYSGCAYNSRHWSFDAIRKDLDERYGDIGDRKVKTEA